MPPVVKLVEILPESLIFPSLSADDKVGALRQMVTGVAAQYPELTEHELFWVVMEREKLSSTGIGSGIAIPHAKMVRLKNHIAVFGRSRIGIPFDSIDGKPVHLIFLILGPQGANEAHLKILARISKFLHDTTFRDRLLTADTAHQIYEAIAAKDARI